MEAFTDELTSFIKQVRRGLRYGTFPGGTTCIYWMFHCMSAIKSHNSQLLKNGTEGEEKRSCNCRKKETCPIEGKCLEEGIIYEATIKSNSDEKKYVGLTEGSFKRRLYGHRQSFRNNNLRTATELSKHIWDLKDRQEEFEISWKIIDRAHWNIQ